jgi:hypothetical protein
VCIVLLINHSKSLDMECVNAIQMDLGLFSPSSLTQDLMVSVILSAYRVRPSFNLG